MPPDGLGETKKLHPFFTSKPEPTTPRPTGVADDRILKEASNTAQGSSQNVEENEEDDEGRSNKRRKTNNPQDVPSLAPKQHLGQENGAPSALGFPIANFFQPIIPSGAVFGYGHSIEQTANQASPVAPNTSTPVSVEPNPTTPTAVDSRPKRILKLNLKTGTIGSPPKPKPAKARPSVGKAGQKPTFIVCICFGNDAESRQRIGRNIESILALGPSVGVSPIPKKRGRPRKADKAKRAMFEGKTEPAKLGESPASEPAKTKSGKPPPAPRQTVFSSTPCSPKKPRSTFKAANLPQFGSKNMGLRVPGAAHPAWPTKGTSHVTGEEHDTWACGVSRNQSSLPWRKSKGRPVVITPQESVVQRLGNAMGTALSQLREDLSQAPELRLPTKHFESGPKLQSRIRPELRTPLPTNRVKTGDDSDEDIITATRDRSHPAIHRLYNSLTTTLSAHDRSECEDVSWAQKYAPESAIEVLQSGREALMLRDWLEALKVQAVDTGPSADAKSASMKPASAGKKKRKRPKNDDFIVSSDEDIFDLDEITDPEDNTAVASQQGQTVVQNGGNIPQQGKDTIRLSNVSLLSGPHGSGKTATVYAIAKELGFEVFEINASTRRSGKDIIEKVGDMTRNHLVQGHHDGSSVGILGEKGKAKPKETKTVARGSVMAFFKPKQTTEASTPIATPQPTTTTTTTATATATASPDPGKQSKPRAQKQSLILLEEVDLLYEEDKQFWATITSLIAQSKRPFIMTCNDESTVPFQTLNLYGIFRFGPPPQDLAVDLLLLAAANEGHALGRPAVQALLESRGGDLRAALTELNYWCQLGVGDRRGGFDWFYPRWPRGCDKDEHGNVVRVISQDTYLEGMGWLGRDGAGIEDPLAAEEELMSQCWNGFQMDMSDWHRTRNMDQWATALLASNTSKMDCLAAYESFSESMSAADVVSQGRFGLRFQDNVDPCHPAIPAKARDDYILGRKLLESPLVVDYQPVSCDASFAIRSKARALAHNLSSTTVSGAMAQTNVPGTVRLLRRSFNPNAAASPITRMDMAYAFDPIAVSDQRSFAAASYLDPSVFDRTMRLITEDVAPFVRGIVTYDRHVAEGRIQRSFLFSEGARPGKRLRQTRTSGDAASLRRESYFRARINPYLVMRTGGQWEQAVTELMDATVVEVPPQVEVVQSVVGHVPQTGGDTTVGGRFVQILPRPSML